MTIDTIDQYLALERTPSTVPARRQAIAVPCAGTLLVARDLVRANTYNPNRVPDDKMELLRQSIVDNGFCFPIVTIYDPDERCFVVIDGFHRYLISGPAWLGMAHVPIVVLPHGMAQRMAATWQFNKARGVHQVDMDADLIRALIEQGVGEGEVAERLGVDLDTVHRYKQLTGIAALFQRANYAMSWEMMEVPSGD